MPTKRYRLKLEHPYAKAGTIVEEEYNNGVVLFLRLADRRLSSMSEISVLVLAMDDWLEEVKEDVTFTNAQKEAIMDKLDEHYPPHVGELKVWLSQHTLKTDSE